MNGGTLKYLGDNCKKLHGYTLIELISVSAIVLIVSVMAIGSVSNIKRFSVEERAVTKLRQIADAEERYRYSSDPSVNPEGTYATFDELVLADYIAEDYLEDDVRAHTVNAFIPYYRLDIVRSPNDTLSEPDANHYYVVIMPIPTKWNLKTFHMIEDGEVWHTYGLRYYER